MSLSVNAKTYSANSFGSNAVDYNGPNKSASVKDNVLMRFVPPKPTAAYSGVTRVYCNLTRTLTLTGAVTPSGDLAVKIEVMVPVGAAGADIDTALNDVGAFLASATYKTHVKTPQINF